MTADLTSLIEKLEAAEGPSRELDARIQCHFEGFDYDRLCGGAEKIASDIDAPLYTASIDQALTLRPDGWVLTGLSDGILDMKYHDVRRLTKWLVGMAPVGAVVRGPDDTGKMVSSMAANPALAVCAAALLAKLTETSHG